MSTEIEALKQEERNFRQAGDAAGLAECLGKQAAALMGDGNHDEALLKLKEQEKVCRRSGDERGLSVSLGNQAVISNTKGDFDAALTALAESERLCRGSNSYELPRCLAYKGVVLRKKGETLPALQAFREATGLFAELGAADEVVKSLINSAMIVADDLGKPQDGIIFAEEAHRIACQTNSYMAPRTESSLAYIRSLMA